MAICTSCVFDKNKIKLNMRVAHRGRGRGGGAGCCNFHCELEIRSADAMLCINSVKSFQDFVSDSGINFDLNASHKPHTFQKQTATTVSESICAGYKI